MVPRDWSSVALTVVKSPDHPECDVVGRPRMRHRRLESLHNRSRGVRPGCRRRTALNIEEHIAPPQRALHYERAVTRNPGRQNRFLHAPQEVVAVGQCETGLCRNGQWREQRIGRILREELMRGRGRMTSSQNKCWFGFEHVAPG